MRVRKAARVSAAILLVLFTVFSAFWGVAGAQGAEPAGPPPNSLLVQGFRFTGNDSIESWMLQDVVSHAVGQYLDIDGLYALADQVTTFYRQQGYWLARAYLPEQVVTDGVVLIGVVEGRYGNVEIESRANVPQELGPRILRDVGPGDVVYGPRLESAILLISDVPGVEASASLSPGSEPGTADLHVVLHPVERFVAVWTANNHGSSAEKSFRSILNARWENPRGYGDHFSFTIFGGSSGSFFGRAAYEAPVNHRELRLNLAYSVSQYKLANEFAVLDGSGDTRRFSVTANHPVLRAGRINVLGEVGYAHTQMQERLLTAESSRTVSGFSSALRAEWQGTGGKTISAALEVRAGSVKFGTGADAAFDAAGPKTAGDFQKATGTVTVTQPFGAGKTVQASASWQWASKNLDPTEKLTLGGPEGVRAYTTDAPSVDEGWLGHLEVRRQLNLRRLPWLRAASLFVDVGQGQVNKAPWPGAGETGRVTLAGAGVGFAWAWDRLNGEVAYALPVSFGGEAPEAGGRLWWEANWQF